MTLIRVFSRILEFILRIYLIREVLSQEILAQMVALDLILTSSLHITKSCFRPSYQQVEQTDHRHNITSAMNLMTFGIATTIVSAAAVCAFQYQRATDLAYLGQAIALYGVAAILEACKEKYAVSYFPIKSGCSWATSTAKWQSSSCLATSPKPYSCSSQPGSASSKSMESSCLRSANSPSMQSASSSLSCRLPANPSPFRRCLPTTLATLTPKPRKW